MEKNQQTKSEINIKGFLIVFGIIMFFTSGLLFLAYYTNNKDLKENNNLLLQKQKEESICSYKKDSLSKELSRLAIYKSLTGAMVYRDEVLMELKHKVGDIVYLKRDSSQAVVSDIVIGGSKYEYYIHYRVILKDNSWEELIPELIY
jgi:hypothetical protein